MTHAKRRASVLAAAGFAALALAGLATGCAKTTTTKGPVVMETQNVPGPTVTQTVTASAPPPAAGTTIGTWSGNGNQTTPAFNVPSSGDYIVSWKYSGNTTGDGGDNFSIMETGSGIGDLPNDIAESGSGSTEITDVSSATDSFNVEADSGCSWTITVKAASLSG